ncbi:MAG: histidine kinase [Solirubrobacterales bacterium]|nr:histidine kinase [Solirubrobacterales bacterium]
MSDHPWRSVPSPVDAAVPLRRWVAAQAEGLSRTEFARLIAYRVAVLSAVLLPTIWAMTGQGVFWPGWAWLGLGVPVLLDRAVRWPTRFETSASQRVALVWALIGVATVTLLATWLLAGTIAGVQGFWPEWPLFGLATAGAAYSLFTLHDRVLLARGRRTLRARVDLLTRTRRQAIDAQASELRRIERDLHDGAQARLVALTLQLGRAEMRLDAQPEVQRLIHDAQREAHLAIAELRDLARGIVPPLLADRGLVAAVQSLAARSPAGTTVEAEHCHQLAPAVENAAYFVIAEAVTNTAKHAQAQRSWVRLAADRGALVVEVGDDGIGGANLEGSGLAGLRARVEALDGTLALQSPPGAGTRLEVRLPCAS